MLADRATRPSGSTHLSCKRDQIKIRDYMDRRVTPPKRVTSPSWGPPPPCKQALTSRNFLVTRFELPLIFTLVAASTSHFLTAAINFSCFFQ